MCLLMAEPRNWYSVGEKKGSLTEKAQRQAICATILSTGSYFVSLITASSQPGGCCYEAHRAENSSAVLMRSSHKKQTVVGLSLAFLYKILIQQCSEHSILKKKAAPHHIPAEFPRIFLGERGGASSLLLIL